MGWFSRKTTFGKSGLLKGFVDCHSHVLPGVDDGARDIAKSRAILSLMEEQGVERLWLTPHIMEDIPNEPEDLKRRFEEFKSAYSGNIELRLAAEHNIDMLFSERFEKDKLLPFNESRILVETSYYNPPMGLYGFLSDLEQKGFIPVLAHPERYVYMDINDYRKLKERGVLFQLNLASVVGSYGETAKKKALKFLDMGLYDHIGTDCHRSSHLRSILDSSVECKLVDRLFPLVENNRSL